MPAPARRIVSLHGGLTDILMEMGLSDRLAGRTQADDDSALDAVPSVGTHLRPNPELVLSLQPDLLLQHGGREEASEQLRALETLGLPAAAFVIEDFPSLFRAIEAIGVLTGEVDRARELVTSLRRRLAALPSRLPRPSVLVEVRHPNLLVAGRGTMANAVVEAAGGENAVRGDHRHVRLGEETLLQLDPEVCLVQQGPMHPAPQPYRERPHYRDLRCAREGRVHVLSFRDLARPGPRAVAAAEQVAALLAIDPSSSSLTPEGRP